MDLEQARATVAYVARNYKRLKPIGDPLVEHGMFTTICNPIRTSQKTLQKWFGHMDATVSGYGTRLSDGMMEIKWRPNKGFTTPPTPTLPTIRNDWEELAEAGRTLAQATDRNRWALGDLAARVERSYGDTSLNKFATEINVRTKTLYDYHRVYHFYGGVSADAENISWSHHREALRLGDINKARWALDKASAKDWKVERFGMILSRYLGKRKTTKQALLDTDATLTRHYRQDDGDYIVLKLTPGMNEYVSHAHYVHIVVTEAA